ncbi:hypothetical protein [Oceanobacillus kapialis]|uniref:DUF4362 domain-containing protein n=1 Tax=Oceanobacillus kapialis TaxID=481353 RepID=A0ABW5PW75_9BACI
MKKGNGSTVQSKKKIISIVIILCGVFVLQGCNTGNGDASTSNIDIANNLVSDLFEGEEIEDAEGFNKIKDSTDQEKIDEAREAVESVDEIVREDGEENEDDELIYELHSALFHANYQLQERKTTTELPRNTVPEEDAQDDEQIEEELPEYQPDENDVVWKNNQLKNKNTLEEFIKVAGENGKDNTSEIRVVKDEGPQGVLIYDLESRYDENADQSWIRVTPDLSYYNALENETQDVFNNAPQQCGYMAKDEEQGFYKFYECRTHWEYHFLPLG